MSASAYVESLLDLLTPLGGVHARRMFGGHGIFKEGLMFALVAEDRCYLRTDDLTVQQFVERGCEPFVFGERDGKTIVSRYYEPPESAMINEQKLKPWAVLAWEATKRSAKPKVKKKAATKKAAEVSTKKNMAPKIKKPL